MTHKECFMRRHAAALRKARRAGRAEMKPSPTRSQLPFEQKRGRGQSPHSQGNS